MEWIKCSERLPEKDKAILAYNKDGIFTCFYEDYCGQICWRTNCQCDIGEHGEHDILDNVTHWQPLPPKE